MMLIVPYNIACTRRCLVYQLYITSGILPIQCPSLVAMEMFAHHNKIEEITRYILKVSTIDQYYVCDDNPFGLVIC